MKTLIKVMKALSDPNRVKIVKLLQHRVMCVCELRVALNLAQSTVSKHLRILEEADLVTWSKDGLWVNYRLLDETPNPFASRMLRNLEQWLEEDPEITELITRLPEIRRENICGV
ncbi:ArsR/SmtB family transcription factor [Desulfatiglans anilini]|uniref:ArsR/SmtB family transcription factor n=1 Tax=Desulfatiglans anilini TaxID=90728 RepID=UPI0004118D4C|nr:metalloregulator ArsR/SmtB family transcription factor [Desulfatiglans anilini]